jgi:hypothetical protein
MFPSMNMRLSLCSPDRRIEILVELEADGELAYSVAFDRKPLILNPAVH